MLKTVLLTASVGLMGLALCGWLYRSTPDGLFGIALNEHLSGPSPQVVDNAGFWTIDVPKPNEMLEEYFAKTTTPNGIVECVGGHTKHDIGNRFKSIREHLEAKYGTPQFDTGVAEQNGTQVVHWTLKGAASYPEFHRSSRWIKILLTSERLGVLMCDTSIESQAKGSDVGGIKSGDVADPKNSGVGL